MMKKLLITSAATFALMSSVAFAASDSSTMTGTLTITGECEVVTRNISATTENFTAEAVSLAKVDNDDISTSDFDNWPTNLSAPANTATVAVLCSASSTNHILTLTSGADTLLDGTNEIAWAPVAGTDAITTVTGLSRTLTASATAATLHEEVVTAEVAAQAIADAIPGEYSGAITVTVSYGTGS
jgi:hypothetical protein